MSQFLVVRCENDVVNIFFYCDVYFIIDTLKEDRTVGKLINYSKYFLNARMKKTVSARKRPYLWVFAVRDIDISEEILYFYGEENLQWHEQVSDIN